MLMQTDKEVCPMNSNARVLSFFLLFSAALLCGAPSDYEKLAAKAKKGEAASSELLEAQKKCYREYILFFREKYKACSQAQKRRDDYLNAFAKKDKALAPTVAKFNAGLVRNALDRKIFADVYKKFSADAEFLRLDKSLWEEKTKAFLSSMNSQLLSEDGKDTEKAYHDIMQAFSEALEKNAVKEMTGKYLPSPEKGSPLFQAALAEVANYKKAADPKAMALSKRNITVLCKYLFREALKHAPELEKIMKEAERTGRERVKRELELELSNPDAAYARYAGSFGQQIPVKGKTMREIILEDPAHKALSEKFAALDKERKRLSAEFMKKTDLAAVAELDKVIREVRSTGKK